MSTKYLLLEFIICVLLAIAQSNANDTATEFNCTTGANSSEENDAIEPSSNEISTKKRWNRPNLTTSCNTSADCDDIRMTCSKNSLCQCSTFHRWNNESKSCRVNITELVMWMQSSATNESETVSHAGGYEFQQTPTGTIFVSKWTKFDGEKERGIDHQVRILIMIFIVIFLTISLYGAIILDYL